MCWKLKVDDPRFTDGLFCPVDMDIG